jgi:hypothetical protein
LLACIQVFFLLGGAKRLHLNARDYDAPFRFARYITADKRIAQKICWHGAVAEGELGDQPMILAAALRPWPSDLMEAHEVSTLVNSLRMIQRSAIQPVSSNQQVKAQLPLL